MPIPTPRKGEKRKDFINRCMKDEVMKREYKDRAQRFAICNSQYDKKEKGETIMGFTHNSKFASDEPPWSEVDKTALPRAAFADQGEAGKKSTWKYPHHWIKGGTKKDDDGIWMDGTMYLHRGGLKAAWAAAQGARSGQKASQTVINHLQRHRNTVGMGATSVLVDGHWLIDESWLKVMYDAAVGRGDPEALLIFTGVEEDDDGLNKIGNAAVIDVVGPIFARENFFTMFGIGISTEKLSKKINMALEDNEVERIILSFDSPGGQVTGINPLALKIKEANEVKPVVAYVHGSAASGAYWLASAASEIVADSTSMVGSIGVVVTYQRKANDEIEIVSTVSPNKRPDPETKEGKAEILKVLDAIADVFVETVATNRGVSKEYVLEHFGRGGIVVGKAALEVGMIDKIDTFENLIKGGEKMEITKEMLSKEAPELLEEIAREAKAELEAKYASLQKELFSQKLSGIVGEDQVKMLMELHGQVDDEKIVAIAEEFARLQKVIEEMGAPKGTTGTPPNQDREPTLEELKQIADAKGISLMDARVEFEKMIRR